jgi:hypothetical protein
VAPDTPETRQDAATAALTAATLGQGRRLDLLSLALLLLALAALLLAVTGLTERSLLGFSVAAGLVQRYYALRSDLDARLFAHWASCWSGLWAPDPQADLKAFDQALSGVFGAGEAPPTPRPLADRVRGALRFLRHQSIALAIQLAAIFGAILWHLSQTGST